MRRLVAGRDPAAPTEPSLGPCTSFCLVHEDLGALVALATCGNKEFSPVGHEKTSSGIRRNRVARKLAVAIGILLLDNVNEALAADHVNPAFVCVIENVGRSARFGSRRSLAA